MDSTFSLQGTGPCCYCITSLRTERSCPSPDIRTSRHPGGLSPDPPSLAFVPHQKLTNSDILLFPQFHTQLDILEDWAQILHPWPVCHIDSGVKAQLRERDILYTHAIHYHHTRQLRTRSAANIEADSTNILAERASLKD